MLSGIHFGAPAGGAPKTAAIIVGRPSDRGLSSLRPSGRRQTARQSGGRPGASLACRSLDWLRIQLGRLRGDQPWTRPSGHWRRSQSNTHRSVVSSWRLVGARATATKARIVVAALGTEAPLLRASSLMQIRRRFSLHNLPRQSVGRPAVLLARYKLRSHMGVSLAWQSERASEPTD